MTDPINDHTPVPTTPPAADAPLDAATAATAATDAAEPKAPKGPTFAELGLHADVLRAIEEMGFVDPMPVQAATLPLIREGRDLM
ncbi:MAG TPA: DEAD/DEAH box helicase, partial [Polyangia bacterium]|nr:DEAD/DEAH box helicase [Polyangia bacterium]